MLLTHSLLPQRIKRNPVSNPVEPCRGVIGESTLRPGTKRPQASF